MKLAAQLESSMEKTSNITKRRYTNPYYLLDELGISTVPSQNPLDNFNSNSKISRHVDDLLSSHEKELYETYLMDGIIIPVQYRKNVLAIKLYDEIDSILHRMNQHLDQIYDQYTIERAKLGSAKTFDPVKTYNVMFDKMEQSKTTIRETIADVSNIKRVLLETIPNPDENSCKMGMSKYIKCDQERHELLDYENIMYNTPIWQFEKKYQTTISMVEQKLTDIVKEFPESHEFQTQYEEQTLGPLWLRNHDIKALKPILPYYVLENKKELISKKETLPRFYYKSANIKYDEEQWTRAFLEYDKEMIQRIEFPCEDKVKQKRYKIVIKDTKDNIVSNQLDSILLCNNISKIPREKGHVATKIYRSLLTYSDRELIDYFTYVVPSTTTSSTIRANDISMRFYPIMFDSDVVLNVDFQTNDVGDNIRIKHEELIDQLASQRFPTTLDKASISIFVKTVSAVLNNINKHPNYDEFVAYILASLAKEFPTNIRKNMYDQIKNDTQIEISPTIKPKIPGILSTIKYRAEGGAQLLQYAIQ